MNLNDVPQIAEDSPSWQLRKLSEKHKLAAALLAQGLGRASVASACDFTPEYITMLQRQPLFIQYVQDMTAAAAVRLEALFDQSVEIIADTLSNGGAEEKLKAARLQLEATGRIGKNAERGKSDGDDDSLEHLAERLVSLLDHNRKRVINGEVSDAEILPER